MVDFVPELHALLDGIAPVYPADVKTSTAAIPCITWLGGRCNIPGCPSA